MLKNKRKYFICFGTRSLLFASRYLLRNLTISFRRRFRLLSNLILVDTFNLVPFTIQELNSILESLNRRDLRSALDWAERNRMELNARGTLTIPSDVVINNNNDDNPGRVAPTPTSSLELKLHKLQFIEILKGSSGGTPVNYTQNRLDAIKYARAHFPRYVQGHEREVATLMGALMYIGPRLTFTEHFCR